MSYALDEGDRCPLKTHARGVYFFLPNHCRDELLLGNQRKRQAVICRRCSFKNIGFQQHLFSIPNHVQHDAMNLSLENFSRSLYPHVSNAILEVPILEHQHYSSDSNYVHRATDISFLRFLPGRTSDDVQRHAKFHRVCCPVQPIPNYWHSKSYKSLASHVTAVSVYRDLSWRARLLALTHIHSRIVNNVPLCGRPIYRGLPAQANWKFGALITTGDASHNRLDRLRELVWPDTFQHKRRPSGVNIPYLRLGSTVLLHHLFKKG